MAMSPEALYYALRDLLATMPELRGRGEFEDETNRWLGRAQALVGESGDAVDDGRFRAALAYLHGEGRRSAAQTIVIVLYAALARAELAAPAAAAGKFIPVGADFTAAQAVRQVLSNARRQALIIDPYLNDVALFEFAPLAPEGVEVRLLGDGGRATAQETLRAGIARWNAQYGATRPLVARAAQPRSLHDRAIIVDASEVWLLSQSFKDLAARSPATLQRAALDIEHDKIAAYDDLWNSAAPIA